MVVAGASFHAREPLFGGGGACAPVTEAGRVCSSQDLVGDEVADRSVGPAASGECHGRFFCEIANFQILRRQLGPARANAVLDGLGERIASAVPAMRVAVAGRGLLEMAGRADGVDRHKTSIDLVRERIGRTLFVEGESHTLELLVAGAVCMDGEPDDIRLVEGAEAALDEARRHGRDVFRDLSGDTGSLNTLSLMRELPGAIRRDELLLQYQAKVHVRRQEVASLEALVRWQHPTRGLIMPGEFIALAEQSGAIRALTLWTLRQAISDQRVLAGDGHILTIYLNISGLLLADRAFIEEACRLIAANGASIGFEITETAVIREPERAIGHLELLAKLGVAIAIDDYGAGLSSLAYLKKLPARELKIDKGFVLQLTSSNRDPLIVRSTIDLAHALDMEVTAEGVETPAALALLSVMGCDMVQGYLLGRPAPLDALRHYLADARHLVAAASDRPTFNRPEAFWKRA